MTKQEIQELWEWCIPERIEANRVVGGLPDIPIDLNNLFKHAVPMLNKKGYSIEVKTYTREVKGTLGKCSWVAIKETEFPFNIVSLYSRVELTDAVYLAIWEVIRNEQG